MSEKSIRQHFEEAASLLQEFLENEGNFQKIVEAGNAMAECLRLGGKILSCGNGGSMCDAMHFAEELSGRYRGERPALSALAISDVSHLTCVGNDYGFDSVFARQVEALGRESDILLAISTSGNSPNVLAAAKAATSRGMQVVALTGKNGGALAEACDIEIRVPWNGYSDRIQEIHIKVIHSLIDHIERSLFPGE